MKTASRTIRVARREEATRDVRPIVSHSDPFAPISPPHIPGSPICVPSETLCREPVSPPAVSRPHRSSRSAPRAVSARSLLRSPRTREGDAPFDSLRPRRGPATMRKYRLISKKGEGTFSEVLKAQSVKNGRYYAIKCMKTHFDSIEQVRSHTSVGFPRARKPSPAPASAPFARRRRRRAPKRTSARSPTARARVGRPREASQTREWKKGAWMDRLGRVGVGGLRPAPLVSRACSPQVALSVRAAGQQPARDPGAAATDAAPEHRAAGRGMW